MKKEELIIELTKEKENSERLTKKDSSLREEFSKAFNKHSKNTFFGCKELEVMSWPQIFVEVGKLLSARNFYDFEGNISECEKQIDSINQEIYKLSQIK